jgi:hypothetical protein
MDRLRGDAGELGSHTFHVHSGGFVLYRQCDPRLALESLDAFPDGRNVEFATLVREPGAEATTCASSARSEDVGVARMPASPRRTLQKHCP